MSSPHRINTTTLLRPSHLVHSAVQKVVVRPDVNNRADAEVQNEVLEEDVVLDVI